MWIYRTVLYMCKYIQISCIWNFYICGFIVFSALNFGGTVNEVRPYSWQSTQGMAGDGASAGSEVE